MTLTHEDFQKAKRISRAIQEHLENTNYGEVRSTDIYPMLARKDLVEKDRNNGKQFRLFLKELDEKGVLESLIPQCRRIKGQSHFSEWYFYRDTLNKQSAQSDDECTDREVIVPALTDDEIEELIDKARAHIDKLPKRNDITFDYNQLEIRKLYNRAYEFWTERELEIMERAYNKFEKVNKVAELLRRQPHVVKAKLEELKLL